MNTSSLTMDERNLREFEPAIRCEEWISPLENR
jgi:hypothetical protein